MPVFGGTTSKFAKRPGPSAGTRSARCFARTRDRRCADRDARRELVHLHRVVDDQLGRDQRVDPLGVAAAVAHRVAHRREVDDRGDAGEVLEEHAPGRRRSRAGRRRHPTWRSPPRPRRLPCRSTFSSRTPSVYGSRRTSKRSAASRLKISGSPPPTRNVERAAKGSVTASTLPRGKQSGIRASGSPSSRSKEELVAPAR